MTQKDVGSLFRSAQQTRAQKLRRESFSSKKIPDVFLLVPALVLAASEVALACPICFRAEESATTDGIQAAVLVLLGVTTVVLGGFGRFVVGFIRHERRQNAGRKVAPAVIQEIQE